ncbi:MAG: response regulator [Thermogemmatispora sp.]|uniref:hybrid sensor histidine kinase/response regulator n=1 Tax=Thermogemmatispora sp. TaxID=1968838 RepID=UPI0019F9F81F|nr:response regulator [Thermogemmatispora sp.]MBE3564790.1 response regulator [Thermogemmatispora sp.]
MSNTFDKLSVLDSFIEEVKSYLPEIEANLDRLAQSPGDMDALEETYRRTHTIGGSASMMDFPGLAHVAHGMEDILGDVLDGLTTLDEPTLALLRRSLRRLHVLIDGIRDNSVNQDAIIAEDDADYSRYRALQEAAGKVVPGSPDLASTPSQPLDHQSQQSVAPEHYAHEYQDYHTDRPGYQGQPQQDYHDSPRSHVPTPPSQRYGFQEDGLDLGESYAYQQQSVSASSPQSTPLPESPYPPATGQGGSLPSFDEMLAAFRTPSTPVDEEPLWPEDPVPLSQQSPATPASPASPAAPATPSALDMLAASFRSSEGTPSSTGSPPGEEQSRSPRAPSPLEELVSRFTAPQPEAQGQATAADADLGALSDWSQPQPQPLAPHTQFVQPLQRLHSLSEQPLQAPSSWPQPESHPSEQPSGLAEEGLVLPTSASRLYSDLRQETLSLEEQVNTLHTLLTQLQQAVSIIEEQRSEFRGFLDGSKDALERMEDWAGQAMGLNLRKSPEKVRRYLPLSVMWVVNTKLKKVLELLSRITSGVEATDEQIQTTLHQLRSSVEACGDLLERLPQALTNQEPGWTPWQVQVARDVSGVRERVTFERQGDLAALRAELEAKIREELRREYEQRPLSLAARMELERQIREEVRQEFERQRQLQHEIVGPDGQESYEELVKRLRNEIEIEVRREFLAQLTGNADLETAANLQQPPSGSGPLPALEIPRAQVNPPPVVTPPPPPSPVPAPPVSSVSGGSAVSEGTDFGEEAAEIFRLEAEEHLQTISMNVAALEKSPEDRDILQSIRRATHTLKGAAGMMGFRLIADLCHVSEDLLDSIMEGRVAINPPVIGIILDTAETLDRLINNRGEDRATLEAAVAAMRARYAELLGEQQLSPLPAEEELESLLDSGEGPESSTFSSTVSEAAPAAGELLMQRSPATELSVRVRLQKLDELVNLFGELLVNRSALEEHIQRLMRLVADVSMSSERLRDVGQKLESRFEAATLPSGRVVQVPPGTGNGASRLPALQAGRPVPTGNGEPAHLAEFDELELDRYTEFHQLTRGLSEGVSDMITLSSEMEAVIRECESIFARESRLSTTFQDRLMKTRLVPLSSMIPRLYRAVRSVALKQHKEINFVTEGEDTEVDRTVYEEIAGPLLHLMRNAVNHAIEEPEVRVRKGKPAAGLVKLSASYEGNQVVITVRDDGTGIDPERVRQAAIARGLIRPDQILSPSDVIDLIFRPGFSTAEVVSEESGRGVGLDVVRDSISRLRATLEVDSTPGQGTAFTMKFPTSLAIQSVMMVRVGDQQYAVPTTLVEAIGRLDTFKRTTHGGRPAVVVQNDVYPLSQLAHYLKLPAGEIDERSPLLLVNTGRHRVALVVDEVRTRMDVVMKNLGPHLRHVHGIAGGTVLGNGRVILILELNELLSVQRRGTGAIAGTLSQPQESLAVAATAQAQMPASVAAAATTVTVNTGVLPAVRPPATPLPSQRVERGRHVLVVDDSPSVRRVVSNMLKQHGWEVQTARDGVEALELISSQPPAAVLLDIEMPRMDGYELMATVRSQEQYRTLPLVVLTSRAASKHKQRAMQLGASAYIVKPYQDEELISTLNRLVYGASA